MSLDIRKLDRICLAIVVIVTLVSGYWFSRQVIKERRLIRQENEIISKKMKELNLAEANLEHLTVLLDTTRKKLESLNARIPDADVMLKALILSMNRDRTKPRPPVNKPNPIIRFLHSPKLFHPSLLQKT